MAVFSNTTQGIEGGILLGIGHGFVSSGLFICAGGILYDRTHTRLITYYRGVAQIMPLFSLLFFVLCLGNSGTPLTLNFIGEFLSLSGVFERMPVLSALAASSIVFSAAYTFFMYNRIVFGGTLSAHLAVSLPDLSKREYTMLIALILPTVLFGIYPAPILDGLHYSVSTLIHAYNDQLGAEQLTMSLFLVGSSKGSAFLAEHKMTYGCPAKVEGKKTMKKIILDIGTILAITGKNIWEDKLPYPTPHIKVMKAGGITELLTSENLEPIITEINRLIPQVDGFIKGINDFVKVTEINVVVDVEGRIGVDILESVPGELAHKWATRVEITHSLIVDRVSTLFSLFKRAVEIEVKIVEVDPNYQVRIPELRANFNAVKSNYKFITL
jgi:NADH-ubiquinone oxidoreductase chain 4